MSYTSLILVLMFVFILPAQAAEQDHDEEFVITPMSEAIQDQTQCGQYFGSNTYPGVAEWCISFSY